VISSPQDCHVGNEHLGRLENTQLADMRRELTLLQQQIEIEVGAALCACTCSASSKLCLQCYQRR